MNAMHPGSTMIVRGVTLRSDPAREVCFKVVHLYTELRRSGDMSAESQREKLHRDYNSEAQSMEIAAASLVDFPDAPWELRMELARQCWDESRHARLYYQRLLRKNGYKGEFPVANHEWSVACMFDTPATRLAVQNRTFEGGTMDSLHKAVKVWSDVGDEETAEMIDAILADEVQHVRFANQWIKRMGREDPGVILKVASAIAQLRGMIGAMGPRPGDVSVNGVDLVEARQPSVKANTSDRSHADFSQDEVGEVVRRQRLEEMMRDVPTRPGENRP